MKKMSWLSENGFQVVLDRLQDGIFVIEDGKLIYVNQRLADMLGHPIEQLIGRSFIEFVAYDDRSVVLERHLARLAGELVPDHYDMRLLTAQGNEIFCSLNVGLGESKLGGTVTVGSIRDVTIQREAVIELEKSKADLRAIFDKLPDTLYRTDMEGVITMASPSCFDLLGYNQEEMIGTALASYYADPEERQNTVHAIINSKGRPIQVESRLKHKNGTIIWVSSNVSLRYGLDNNPAFIEGVARNICERKKMEAQLIEISRTDSLTGTYSRRHFIERSEEVINLMRRYQRPISLMIADIDHFKAINDNYGHQAGDISLRAFAKVCSEEIRETDILGRLGGEEFGLILPETSINEAKVLAERICKTVNALDIHIDNQTIKLTVSIGLVELCSVDGELDELMRRADLAMYQAKSCGRNQVVSLSA